jgi:hypothetical protein
MPFYFRTIPNLDYINPEKTSSISDYIQIKNLFRRGRLREDIFGDLVYFTKYNIVGNERPDQVAEKYYSDPSLDWVILLSNNILDVRSEWPLDNNSFDSAMLDKYGSYENLHGGIHHYETIEIKNSDGIVMLPSGIRMKPNWKTNGNFVEVNTKKIFQIFCGDGITPTNIASVTLSIGIQGLKIGDEINISNITDNIFNGTFRVTDIQDPFGTGNISAFSYQLSSVPDIASPPMSNSNLEEAAYSGGVSGNSYYFEYTDKNSTIRLASSKVLTEVSNYDYELNLNNKKREIYILKPTYLGIILNDAEEFSSYKIGGSQYVNDTLKRGENSRLYS